MPSGLDPGVGPSRQPFRLPQDEAGSRLRKCDQTKALERFHNSIKLRTALVIFFRLTRQALMIGHLIHMDQGWS